MVVADDHVSGNDDSHDGNHGVSGGDCNGDNNHVGGCDG